ncbi:MAG: adenylate/guanylate cyclase domain-containing protein [Planctomycetota bacterium]|nr:adenylate/guanylate cyclase domain-containing protein [Planctomycetota bacterium]MDA1180325.1 adenylate/guanylate cyclase domain-containing protein [Planctomycetota bacterium]
MKLRIAVDLGFSEVFVCEASSAVDVGRQRDNEPPPFSFDGQRLVLAAAEEVSVSRSQLVIEPLDDRRVAIRNTSQTTQLDITSSGHRLAAGEVAIVDLPAVCRVGTRVVRIGSSVSSVHTLSHATQSPGTAIRDTSRVPVHQLRDLAGDLARLEPLIRTLQQIVDMLQHATSENELFQQACTASVELLGLQQARVFLRNEFGVWRNALLSDSDTDVATVDSVSTVGIRETMPRSMVGRLHPDLAESLNGVLREKRVTFGFTESTDIRRTVDPQGFIVAAPLMNRAGEVIGVLCASQPFHEHDVEHMQVAKLQAQLLEMIACAVSSALLRLEQEKGRKKIQVQFDQFFSTTLSQHLERQPDLLEGRDAEVSLLFCDIRNFTRHSENLPAAVIFAWVNDVMETLSQCVMEFEGVLVDYIGDELIAMWGAPEHQPDHALRACRAAIAMLRQMPELNERWQSTLNHELQVGIGVNTGPVRVGNTGSQLKFKYGPLGPTVNIASRIQGATKYVDCPVLIADSTFQSIHHALKTRPICQVRLVNVERPVTLYELVEATDRDPQVCAQYEQALEMFGRGQLEETSRILGRILQEQPKDGPSRILLKRTLEFLIDDRLDFDAAWNLPGK